MASEESWLESWHLHVHGHKTELVIVIDSENQVFKLV